MNCKSAFFPALFVLFTACNTPNSCPNLTEEEIKEIDEATAVAKRLQHDSAIILYSNLLKKNALNHVAWSSVSTSRYQKWENEPDSLLFYKDSILNGLARSLQICSTYPTGYRNMIRIAYNFQDFPKVISYSNLYYKLGYAPVSDILTMLADAHFEQGNCDSSLYYGAKAIETEPVFLFAHVIRAKCLNESDRYIEALNEINLYLEKYPAESPVALHELGNSLFYLEKYAEAQQCFETALLIDSTSLESLAGLGLIQIAQNNYDEGCRLIHQAYDGMDTIPKLPRIRNGTEELIRQHCRRHPPLKNPF